MILETDVDETHCPQPRGRASSSDRRKNRDIPRERILERVVTQIVNMSGHTHTQSGGEYDQRSSISRSKLRTHRMQRFVSRHDPAVNSVEVKQSKIIKNTVLSKNPIVQEKINQVSKEGWTRSRASTFDKLAVVSSVIQSEDPQDSA